MHTHAFLVFGIALLISHVTSLTYETGTILLVLLHSLTEDIAVLALIVGILLISNRLIVEALPVIVLAARRHHNI